MKSNLNKIILYFVTIFFLSSCHTLEHQNIFLETVKKNQKQEIFNIEEKDTQIKSKKIENKKSSNKDEMAPIKVPNQKQKVKTVALIKKINIPRTKKIDLNVIINWSEKKLLRKMGQSDFIKEEGKLKNYQYYFSSCFLDVFLLKEINGYRVNYIQTRSTKLYGKIETQKCLKEISKKLN
jgi:hypothetical protein